MLAVARQSVAQFARRLVRRVVGEIIIGRWFVRGRASFTYQIAAISGSLPNLYELRFAQTFYKFIIRLPIRIGNTHALNQLLPYERGQISVCFAARFIFISPPDYETSTPPGKFESF